MLGKTATIADPSIMPETRSGAGKPAEGERWLRIACQLFSLEKRMERLRAQRSAHAAERPCPA